MMKNAIDNATMASDREFSTLLDERFLTDESEIQLVLDWMT